MSVGAIGGRTPGRYDQLDEIAVGNPMARLAKILMESKDRSEEAQDQMYETAKARIVTSTAQEVSSMRDAADDLMTGAIVSGACMGIGAGLSAAAVANTPLGDAAIPKSVEYLRLGSSALSAGSKVADGIFQAKARGHDADAAQARGATAMARTDLEQADTERKRAVNARDEAAAQLRSSIKENHDARMEAIRTIRG